MNILLADQNNLEDVRNITQMIETENGDYLCYDVMRLEKADDNSGY